MKLKQSLLLLTDWQLISTWTRISWMICGSHSTDCGSNSSYYVCPSLKTIRCNKHAVFISMYINMTTKVLFHDKLTQEKWWGDSKCFNTPFSRTIPNASQRSCRHCRIQRLVGSIFNEFCFTCDSGSLSHISVDIQKYVSCSPHENRFSTV